LPKEKPFSIMEDKNYSEKILFLFFNQIQLKYGSLADFAPKSPKGDFLPLFAAHNAVAVPFRDGKAKLSKNLKYLKI